MYSFGMVPPLILLTKSKPSPGAGSRSMSTIAVLARAAGLADEAALDVVRRAADGLAVGDLRPADVGLDVELALHAVDDDLEVQLAHAGDLGLAGLLVGRDAEGRVLLGEPAERDRHLLLVGLGLRLDGDLDHRLGEDDLLEHDRRVRRGQRVAGRRPA